MFHKLINNIRNKTQKGFPDKEILKWFLIFVIIIVVFALIGYGIYSLWNMGYFEKPQTGVEFNNWKIYRNEKLGFEIKYPGDWETKVSGLDEFSAGNLSINISPTSYIYDGYEEFEKLSVVSDSIKKRSIFIDRYPAYETSYVIKDKSGTVAGRNIAFGKAVPSGRKNYEGEPVFDRFKCIIKCIGTECDKIFSTFDFITIK